jgi:hypothetical protein
VDIGGAQKGQARRRYRWRNPMRRSAFSWVGQLAAAARLNIHSASGNQYPVSVRKPSARSALRVPDSRGTNNAGDKHSLERHGRTDMPRAKQTSKRTSRKEIVPVLGAVGVSLSLAGSASAATVGSVADIPFKDKAPAPGSGITLNEEEISDVSLGTFFVFDKENLEAVQPGQQYARGCGGCRGCRGCGGRGCRGCGGGCGGCGCGGCGCCFIWGVCRVC